MIQFKLIVVRNTIFVFVAAAGDEKMEVFPAEPLEAVWVTSSLPADRYSTSVTVTAVKLLPDKS